MSDVTVRGDTPEVLLACSFERMSDVVQRTHLGISRALCNHLTQLHEADIALAVVTSLPSQDCVDAVQHQSHQDLELRMIGYLVINTITDNSILLVNRRDCAFLDKY